MSTLHHLMGVTFSTSQWPSCLWNRPYSPMWELNKAFSGLEEKYLHLFLISACLTLQYTSPRLNLCITGFILYLISDTFGYGGKTFCTNCFSWWVNFLSHRQASGPRRIRMRSSGHVNTFSWFKLTVLNRCYGRDAGTYPGNCITVFSRPAAVLSNMALWQ